jgi:predicted Zn-dependent peptidase
MSADAAPAAWFDEVKEYRLLDSVPCLYQNDRRSETTVVLVFIPGGRRAVPEGWDGLTYLVTRLTTDIPDEDKAAYFVRSASRVSVSVLEDVSVVEAVCLSSEAPRTMQTLFAVMGRPLFSSTRIQNIKGSMELLAGLEQDDLVALGHNAAAAGLFGSAGYGTSVYGSPESLRRLGRREITRFYEERFHRQAVFLSVSSDLSFAELQPTLEGALSKLRPGGPSATVSLPAASPPLGDACVERGAGRSLVSMAFALPAPDIDSIAAGLLLETILGKGPGSRLWPLRARELLAYNLDARLAVMKEALLLEVYLGSSGPKAALAQAALEKLLTELHGNGVPEDELEASRTQAVANLARRTETKQARALHAGLWFHLGLGPDAGRKLLSAVEAMDAERLNAFLKLYLDPGRAVRVRIGSEDAAEPSR